LVFINSGNFYSFGLVQNKFYINFISSM